jgi:hypothetical protein
MTPSEKTKGCPESCPLCGGRIVRLSEECGYCLDGDCGYRYPTREMLDNAIRQDERDKMYKRLKKMTTIYHYENVVPWSDIDCLFAELKNGG